MRTILATAALIVALFGFSLTPAIAQQAERDAAVSSCTVAPVDEAACTAAIGAYIATIADLPATESDALLVDLVIELALAATPETQETIADAIVLVAAAIVDLERRAAVIEVAALVRSGTAFDAEVVLALASPS